MLYQFQNHYRIVMKAKNKKKNSNTTNTATKSETKHEEEVNKIKKSATKDKRQGVSSMKPTEDHNCHKDHNGHKEHVPSRDNGHNDHKEYVPTRSTNTARRLHCLPIVLCVWRHPPPLPTPPLPRQVVATRQVRHNSQDGAAH